MSIVGVCVHEVGYQRPAVWRVDVDPIVEGHADLAMAVHATVPLRNLAVVARFAQKVQQAHVG